ncbi:MAG: PIN domain-containing protein [Oscillospiraceae bacterium]|nr:PIN domain-containing protein [Oscillospiraceae bacterium]
MKVYLDNCCFNRPFDDQTSLIICLETEAKLYVQEQIRQGKYELLWSFVLDYENGRNPFEEIRNRIAEWKSLAVAGCTLSDGITIKASELTKLGLTQMDASHIACAIALGADCFLTTDKKILNKPIAGIECLNPIDFVRRYLHAK